LLQDLLKSYLGVPYANNISNGMPTQIKDDFYGVQCDIKSE